MPHSDPHRGPLRERLQELFERAKLPTSPAIARQILALIDDPYSSAQQFARLIEADPALAARLLKMSNSVAYGQRNQVTTIQRAVTVIGLGQLRVVALGFELVGHLDRLGSCPFDLRVFWQEAVMRACLARETALKVVPALAEEAFLVGLLQDCGILPLVQGLGPDYADLYRDFRRTPAEFFREERKRFPYTHVDAIETLASLWQFPPSIAKPLATHHRRVRLGARSPDETRLAAVGHLVSLFSFTGGAAALPDDEAILAYAAGELHLDEAALRQCLKATEQGYRQVAPMIEFELHDLDVTDLMVVANRHLREHVSDAETRAREVTAERDEVLDQQQTLQHALGQYREQAARDPLTGIMNRRALLDAAGACLYRAASEENGIAVMFLDVDDFKRLNDSNGHPVGDEVLKAVAECAARTAGEHGCAGRYGGEEFVVIVPVADPMDAERCGADLVSDVRSSRATAGGDLPAVTVSLGCVWCHLEPMPRIEPLIAAADERMYAAKRSGKDRCCFSILEMQHGSEPGEPPRLKQAG